MAEERLIDDDKDRKYRIRKNADGEDELYIVSSDDEKEDDAAYLVPELEEDDEEAAVLTPEELAEREREREEAEAARQKAIADYTVKAGEFFAIGDFDGAAYAAEQALGLNAEDGALNCLRLRAVTKDFNDFSRADDCAKAANGVKNYASDEQKAELCELSAEAEKRMHALASEVETLTKENDEKKSERRKFFLEKRKKALIFNAVTAIPFAACLFVALYFASVMFANLDYTNQIITFVFAGLAGVLFIATLFALRNLVKCQRNLSMNEKNSSTKLGRELEEKKAECALIEKVIASFKDGL